MNITLDWFENGFKTGSDNIYSFNRHQVKKLKPYPNFFYLLHPIPSENVVDSSTKICLKSAFSITIFSPFVFQRLKRAFAFLDEEVACSVGKPHACVSAAFLS